VTCNSFRHALATTRSDRYFGASYKRISRIDQAGAPLTVAVCVMRMNFALTGANLIAVVPGAPSPSAIGALHVLPSLDTCT
jgi:hypothetical protein